MESSFVDFLVGQIVKALGGAFLVISFAKVRPCPQLSSTTIRFAQTNRPSLIPATTQPSDRKNLSWIQTRLPLSYRCPASTC